MVSKFERRKDTVQELTESTATHVGNIAMLITTCVREVTREIGDLITDGFEMREAAKQASRDDRRQEDLAGVVRAELPAGVDRSASVDSSSIVAGETGSSR